MLLIELAPAHTANPTLKAAADAIAPFWKFRGAFVDPKRSTREHPTVQFRRPPEEHDGEEAGQGYNSLDYKSLDDKIQNALHQKGVPYQHAGFEEIPRTISAKPLVAYTIEF